MAQAAVARRTAAVARPLKVLVPLIQADLERGDRAGMEYYADAGDKLIEAKEQVTHGHWGAWLSKNFDLGQRQAQLYMQAAEKRSAGSVLPRSLSDRPRRLHAAGASAAGGARRDQHAEAVMTTETTSDVTGAGEVRQSR